jgi:hypothetical protein
MTRERKRVLGELAAWHLAGVAGCMPFVHARLDPAAINPYRDRAAGLSRQVEKVRAFIAARGLAAFCRGEREDGG